MDSRGQRVGSSGQRVGSRNNRIIITMATCLIRIKFMSSNLQCISRYMQYVFICLSYKYEFVH